MAALAAALMLNGTICTTAGHFSVLPEPRANARLITSGPTPKCGIRLLSRCCCSRSVCLGWNTRSLAQPAPGVVLQQRRARESLLRERFPEYRAYADRPSASFVRLCAMMGRRAHGPKGRIVATTRRAPDRPFIACAAGGTVHDTILSTPICTSPRASLHAIASVCWSTALVLRCGPFAKHGRRFWRSCLALFVAAASVNATQSLSRGCCCRCRGCSRAVH